MSNDNIEIFIFFTFLFSILSFVSIWLLSGITGLLDKSITFSTIPSGLYIVSFLIGIMSSARYMK